MPARGSVSRWHRPNSASAPCNSCCDVVYNIRCLAGRSATPREWRAMSQRTGRNELCPCGSGKKMKACHPNGVAPVSKNRNIMLIGLGVAVVAVVGAAMMREDTSGPLQATPNRPMSAPMQAPARSATQNPARPATQSAGANTPQPGPAPPGKVWSPEHGHWHDANAAAASGPSSTSGPSQAIQMPSPQRSATQAANQQPAKNIPPPTGIAPPGKVWSPEHGHYHDAPKTPPAGTAAPATATPSAPAKGTGPN